jgi:UDP-glucose 4-epimerase
MRIVVTGGAGFIGSHIVDAYLAAGHEVAIIDNLSTGQRANINPAARFYELDLRAENLAEIIKQEHPHIINHPAAQIDVRKSVQDPRFDADVNILGSLNLLEAARATGVKHIIFASTGGAIYGEQDYFPADESHPIRPLSPYGIAKLAVEKYLDYYNVVHGMSYTILRYANVYGPRQNPKGEAGVVAIFCEQMLNGRNPTINGDGKQTRDYVFVGDVMRANLQALESHADVANSIFNIGTGIETDVNELYQVIQQQLGREQTSQHGPAKAGEQLRSVLDARRAERQLGWRASIDLNNGLKHTIDFYLSRQSSQQIAAS